MSVTVAGIVFDGAEGTPTPKLSDAQLSSYAALASTFFYKGTAPTDDGELVAWKDCTAGAASTILRQAGAAVAAGAAMEVVYPHGTITPLRCASVTGDWRPQRGTVNGGVLVVKFTFNTLAASKSSGEDAARSLVEVQTAPALAGPWTARPTWACFASSDGLGTYAGESEAAIAEEAPDPAFVGLWVRLRRKGTTDYPWGGVITGATAEARRDPSQGIPWGARTVYRFAGVGHVLAQLYATEYREALEDSPSSLRVQNAWTPPAGATADVGQPPTFNDEGKGNRSASTYPAGPGGVYLHARGLGSGGGLWDCGQTLANVIAAVRASWPTVPAITVSDPGVTVSDPGGWLADACPPLDLSRKSLLHQIATILHPDRLFTFRLALDYATPAIVVHVVSLDPARDAGATVSLLDGLALDWRASIDGSATVDRWYLDAGPRRYLQTVLGKWDDFDLGFLRGWTATQETDWNAATDPLVRESLALANVGRRFMLAGAYAGDNWRSTALAARIPYRRALVGTEESGELLSDPAVVYPHGSVWRLDHQLPTGVGRPWDQYTATVGAAETQEGPLVYWYKAGQPLEPVHFNLQITVGDDDATVTLGRDSADAETVKAKMQADGYAFAATLAFLHPLSWRVSAVQASPRTDCPRVGMSFLPPGAFARVDAVEDVIVGADAAGAAVVAAAGRRDGGGELTDLRQKYRRYFLTTDNAASWSRRGVATLTPDPGSIVASLSVIVKTSPTATASVLLGSPITRRTVSWDAYNPGVTWNADRISPDLRGEGGRGAVVAAGGPHALAKPSTPDGLSHA